MISLSQLRAFLEVARLGSVQEASEALVISQPAVSAALAALQRTVGVRLTERDGRKIRLTEAGRTYEAYGRRMLALLAEAERRAREVNEASATRLRLTAVTTAAEHLVPRLLQAFRERQPQVAVELDVGNHVYVWDRLRHWEADLVIGGRPPSDLAATILATRPHEMIVIAPAGERYSQLPLGEATWLVREAGSGTRVVTEQCFASIGIDPPRLTITSNGAINACVRAGLGYSLVSRDGVESDLRNGAVQQIATPFTPLERRWHLVGPQGREIRRGVEDFVEFATAFGGFVAAPLRLGT